jgi:hypothetical protein
MSAELMFLGVSFAPAGAGFAGSFVSLLFTMGVVVGCLIIRSGRAGYGGATTFAFNR